MEGRRRRAGWLMENGQGWQCDQTAAFFNLYPPVCAISKD